MQCSSIHNTQLYDLINLSNQTQWLLRSERERRGAVGRSLQLCTECQNRDDTLPPVRPTTNYALHPRACTPATHKGPEAEEGHQTWAGRTFHGVSETRHSTVMKGEGSCSIHLRSSSSCFTTAHFVILEDTALRRFRRPFLQCTFDSGRRGLHGMKSFVKSQSHR